MAQISSKNCELCTENNGVFYCYECQHALCDSCRRKHDKIPSTRGHTVTDIQNVDLATFNSRSQCVSHEREFLFYCVKCSDLMCSKCVTTTHKDHAVSEIAEMILNEREQATNTLPEIKAKIEDISALKENVTGNHLNRLTKDSKHVVEDIGSTYQELTRFIESKKNIRITEIEDNEKLERQNLESFLQNIGHVTKHFSRTFSELENILSEKHDITFFTGYKTLQGDIKHLDNVPEPPTTVEVKSFDKRMFYKEIVDYIQSKVDDSICKHCDDKTMTIGEMQKEQMNLEQKLNRSIKKNDDELKMFKQKIESLEKKSRDAELRATQDIQKKDEELNILRQEKESLKNRKAEIPEKEVVDAMSDLETEIATQDKQQKDGKLKILRQKKPEIEEVDDMSDLETEMINRELDTVEPRSQTPSRSPNYSSYGRSTYTGAIASEIPAGTNPYLDLGPQYPSYGTSQTPSCPPHHPWYGTSQTPSCPPHHPWYGTRTEKDKGVEEKAEHKCTRRCRRGCNKS